MKPLQQYVHMAFKNTHVVLNVNFYSVDEVLWFHHWFGLLLFVCLNQKTTFGFCLAFSTLVQSKLTAETVTNCIRKIRQSALKSFMYFSS